MAVSSDLLAEKALLLVFRLLARLPLRGLQALGTLTGNLLWLCHADTRRITEINLAHCYPGLDAQARRQLAHESVVESAKTLFEIAAIWVWPPEKSLALVTRVSGLEHFEAAKQGGQGWIILAPHLGNWELVGLYHARHGGFTAMYAPSKIPALGRIIHRGRTANGSVLVPASAGGVKALLRALKAAQPVGILPDQVPEPGSGVLATFFGEPAQTMTLVSSLGARTGASAVCCYARRLPQGAGFEMCFVPVDVSVTSESADAAAQALNDAVERCVRACPEQYQWEYKRFKKRPGLPKLY